jgi:hypothetical protein
VILAKAVNPTTLGMTPFGQGIRSEKKANADNGAQSENNSTRQLQRREPNQGLRVMNFPFPISRRLARRVFVFDFAKRLILETARTFMAPL